MCPARSSAVFSETSGFSSSFVMGGKLGLLSGVYNFGASFQHVFHSLRRFPRKGRYDRRPLRAQSAVEVAANHPLVDVARDGSGDLQRYVGILQQSRDRGVAEVVG